MEPRSLGLLIIGAGVLLAAVGVAVYYGGFSWFGRLPGDIRYHGYRHHEVGGAPSLFHRVGYASQLRDCNVKENTPPDLPAVTREIVNALLAGDWMRYSDDSGSHYYYIIREQDYGVEVDAGRAFANMLSFDKKEPDAFEHWYVRATLAEEPADRLSKARKKFVAAGGGPARFDKTIAEFRVGKTGPKESE